MIDLNAFVDAFAVSGEEQEIHMSPRTFQDFLEQHPHLIDPNCAYLVGGWVNKRPVILNEDIKDGTYQFLARGEKSV